MIGQTISHYRILSLLGEGGMGAVYVAEDTRLGRKVAVKIPREPAAADNSFHARFLREARSISQLSHPNIATVHDFGETPDGQPFIVMELVEGRELGDLLREGGLTLQRAVEIVTEVAEALAVAHERGVIHRDIKPSNVVVNSRGGVKVLDFGLAKMIGEGQHAGLTSEDNTLMKFRTRSDVLLGTPLYLSPEQAKGIEVDPRSDIFALGALLYECVAGRPAFSGATVMEIAGQVIHVNPPPPSFVNPGVPAELDRVTMKALAKRPDERYQTAAEMIEDLRLLSPQLASNGDAHTTAAPRPSARTMVMAPLPSTPQHARASAIMTLSENLRRPRLSLAALLGVLVIVLGMVWGVSRILRPSPHEPEPEAKRQAETGAAEMRDGAFWHASKTLQRAIEIDDRYALAHARFAEALMELDDSDRAKESLLRVSELVPDSSVLADRDRLYLNAVTATARRDFSMAIAAYEEIVRLWPKEAAAYVDLGRAYERREQAGDLDSAIKAYLEATRRDKDYPTAYLRIGNLYTRRQEYDSAIASYKRAEELYKERGSAESRAEVLYRRGLLLRSRGQLADARAQLDQALHIASTNEYEAKRVAVLLQLSIIATDENNAAQAATYANDAIERAQSAGLQNLVASGLVNLGRNFFGRGAYAEAEKYMQQGRAFAERSNARRVRATALGNLGSMYIQQGRTDEGLALVEQALDFFRSGGYVKDASEVLVAKGRGQRDKGNYKEALEIFNQALQSARQVGDPSLIAIANTEIGNALLRQEDFPQALGHFDESYAIEKSLGRESRVGYSLLSRSDALWSLGRDDEVPALLAEAKKIAQKPGPGNTELLINIHLTAAKSALSQSKPSEARAQATEALKLAGENKRLAAAARLVLAVAQVRAGGAPAVAACGEALAAAQQVNDPVLVSAAQLALAEAELRAGDAERAAAHAAQAQEAFARGGQTESEWRAWLIAAGAKRRVRDEAAASQFAARASAALNTLAQKWGPEAFASYQTRRDVQQWQRQLTELSAARPPA